MEMTLYSRSNCSLCEAMEEELAAYITQYKLTIYRVFIDNDLTLEDRYGSLVPVLVYDGTEVCRYYLDRDRLLQIIENENQV